MNRLLLTLLFLPLPTYAQTKMVTEFPEGARPLLKKFPSGCNEVRVAGEVLYWKRISNGEVVQLYRK